ncbi:MAG TPA: ceramidase domain-containing protein [Terriglobales bacterium]|nr:ceramidase domain-containing protein [Terriglobales bacterium]
MNRDDAAVPDLRLPWLVPLVTVAVASAGLIVLGLRGWPGVIGSSGTEFCEALRPGIIKQPANTWSNIAFVAAGLAAGWLARRDLAQPVASGNRMRTRLLYPTLYATTAAIVGPLSGALHASATTWGGRIDVVSMFGWAVFTLMYALARLHQLSDRQFVLGYVFLTVSLSTLFLSRALPVSGSFLFGLVLLGFGVAEWRIYRERPELSLQRGWLAASLGIFLVALTIWYLSRTGNPWCDPHSLLQGHAAWHVLNGLAMFTLYLFFRSEEPAGRT